MSDVAVLVRRMFPVSLRKQRAFVALMLAFVALMLVANGVVAAGVTKYTKSVQYKSALNLIELSSVSPNARQQLTPQNLAAISKRPDVTGVYPWYQVDLALTDASTWPDPRTNPGALWATPVIPGKAPRIALGAMPETGPGAGQIVLPRSVPGGRTDALLGRTVTMEYTKMVTPGHGQPARRSFTVIAIADNSTPDAAGLTPSYVSMETLSAMRTDAGNGIGVDSAFVRVVDSSKVSDVQAALAKDGYAVTSVATQLRSLGGLFKALSWTGWLLGLLLVLGCLSLGATVGSSWVQQRVREIGLLRALGWEPRRVAVAVLAEVLALAGVTAVLGTVVGVVGSLVATKVLAGRRIDQLPVDAWQAPGLGVIVLALVLVPVCVAVGAARSVHRAANTDPDTALRDL